MAKNKDKIKISFVGPAADDVTGSCIWIKTPNRQILLECGLYQSCGSTLENYKINKAHFEFKPKEIDYLFVMHNHADHLCLAPRLYAKGCRAQMIMPKGSEQIAEILLRDSANIMQADADELSSKFKRDYFPIYTDTDVDACLKHYTEYPMNEIVTLDEYVRFRFVPSGHILNSAQIELWVTCGNLTKKIVYTSDLGNIHIKKHYSTIFEPVSKCDVLIGESTYAHESKVASVKTREKDLEKLESAIRQTCIEDKSRVLLPVFANDRCQNMLTYLYDIFGDDDTFDVPILVDSPMARRCCTAYLNILEGEEANKWREVLGWKNVHFVEDHIESREWRDMNTPVVVLASSGMLVKGRSVGWVYSMLPKAKDRIIFCGYSAEGSTGAIIKEGKQKTITVSGKRRANRCQVTNLLSFTSHMQRDSLLKYYGSVQCEKIILVHGDKQGRMDFTKYLQEEISKNNNTGKIVVAQKGYELSL
jgi:metallo-beta-lactamase family protein